MDRRTMESGKSGSSLSLCHVPAIYGPDNLISVGLRFLIYSVQTLDQG